MTNLLIGFPQIGINARSLTVSPTSAIFDTLQGEAALTGRGRVECFETQSYTREPVTFLYSLTSGYSANFLSIQRAKTLQKSSVSSVILHASDQILDLPNNISNCVLWLDAERNVVYDANGQVSSWIDRSGGLPFNQSTAANKPRLTRCDNRENICTASEDLTNTTYWTATRVTATSNTKQDPVTFGLSADEIQEDTSTNTHFISQSLSDFFIGGRTYRFSIYLGRRGRDKLALSARGTAFTTTEINIDLGAVTVSTSSGSPLNATISTTNGGQTVNSTSWYRVSFEVVATGTGAGTIQLNLRDNSGNLSYTGDGTSGCYAFGAQVQRAVAASDYVPCSTWPQYMGVNGRRTLWFRQNDHVDFGSAPSWIGSDFTLFAVVSSHKNGIGSEGAIVNCYTAATNGWFWGLNVGQVTTLQSTSGNINASTVIGDDTPELRAVSKSGTSVQHYTNKASDGSGSMSHTAGTFLNIGYGSAAMASIRGNVCEVIAFSRALTVGEISRVNIYLYDKWMAAQDESRNKAFYNATLVGPRAEDYLTSVTSNAAHQNWQMTLCADNTSANTSQSSITKYKHSKQYFGSAFDFGRDPIYTDIVEQKTAATGASRDSALKIILKWEGITNAKVTEFQSSIAANKDFMPFVLYEASDQVLRGWKAIHVKLLDYLVTPVSPNINTVEATFEELI